jgi:hypothetical protein
VRKAVGQLNIADKPRAEIAAFEQVVRQYEIFRKPFIKAE